MPDQADEAWHATRAYRNTPLDLWKSQRRRFSEYS